jgi:hypothetical protein
MWLWCSKEMDGQKRTVQLLSGRTKTLLFISFANGSAAPMVDDQQHQLSPIVIRSTHDPPVDCKTYAISFSLP